MHADTSPFHQFINVMYEILCDVLDNFCDSSIDQLLCLFRSDMAHSGRVEAHQVD